MKFNAKYKIGDTKRKLKFALMPIKIDNTWVWLEYYILIKKYCKTLLGESWIDVGLEVCDNDLE